jgi:hypothetical protein
MMQQFHIVERLSARIISLYYSYIHPKQQKTTTNLSWKRIYSSMDLIWGVWPASMLSQPWSSVGALPLTHYLVKLNNKLTYPLFRVIRNIYKEECNLKVYWSLFTNNNYWQITITNKMTYEYFNKFGVVSVKYFTFYHWIELHLSCCIL